MQNERQTPRKKKEDFKKVVWFWFTSSPKESKQVGQERKLLLHNREVIKSRPVPHEEEWPLKKHNQYLVVVVKNLWWLA
jgi:hypothetical protein